MSRTAALAPDLARPSDRKLLLWLAGAAVIALLSVVALRHVHAHAGRLGAGFWLSILFLWLAAWKVVGELAKASALTRPLQRLLDLLVPLCFGAFLLFLWEVLTVGLRIPAVLLPSPSAIGVRLAASSSILLADFIQTFVRAVIPGWALGCVSGFLVAILADRVPFLARGLIPIGNFVSALPIIGIAPIMVMWFGFDWHSKVAVVVVMTFFPMLVNTIAGLAQSSHLERDLMRSYGATYGHTLLKLRLWAALPFIFNALKINSTLALIGAIVAEFFGTPIVGMGFRISTEVGRMSLDMVWAEIAVAALAGSAFYGLIVLVERAATFWHPSYRAG
ncbi:MAG TPA: ABC transporter permease [Aestuariivirgaceae bacterium]|jgi:NitT/TauT family transport system permease protein